AEPHLGEPELRICLRDADVARERDLEAAAEAVAVDRRDDGDRRGLDQVGDGLDPARPSARVALADEARDVSASRERALALAAQDDDARVAAEFLERVPERVEDDAVDRIDRRVVEPDGLDHAPAGSGSPALANISRSSVLRNLPTLVFGISSTNSNRSGSHHLAKFGARNSRSCSGVALAPSFRTTAASGRSAHFSSGIAITAASAIAGCAISAPSSSTDEIHSPPDLITSFARSLIWM